MKKFLGSIGGKICAALLAVVLLAGLGCAGHYLWYDQQPKFQGVTIELGEPLPPITAFLTEHAKPDQVRMVTPPDTIDLTAAGEQTIVFAQGKKIEPAVLTIVDTTAPTVTFRDIIADIVTELKPEDFVAEATDLSKTTVSFVGTVDRPDSYGEATVEVAVTDASGNVTTGQCKVDYVWIWKEFTLELGDTLHKTDLLLDPKKNTEHIDQAVLDQINASPVGTYRLTSTIGGKTCECVITVQDTTAPALELQSKKIYLGDPIAMEDFIVSATDAAGDVTVTLQTTLDNMTEGTQTVTLAARDINGNEIEVQTTLEVIRDTIPPVFEGLTDIDIGKFYVPDYLDGVRAVDEKDGEVTFTYDVSGVNQSVAGTYYVVYTAVDASGNEGVGRRKVVVGNDAADTAALVASIAEGLSDNPERLRNYVRNNVRYNSDWGGEDPVWYGFKYKKGNCYVHALCFQELLNAKGIPNQLIWVEDQTHYWNLVMINGEWKHMDATPGWWHTQYSIMNDQERYDTLKGRDWDRTKWPACK